MLVPLQEITVVYTDFDYYSSDKTDFNSLTTLHDIHFVFSSL